MFPLEPHHRGSAHKDALPVLAVYTGGSCQAIGAAISTGAVGRQAQLGEIQRIVEPLMQKLQDLSRDAGAAGNVVTRLPAG